MCGICGIIDFKQQLPSSKRRLLVEKMNDKLTHRGPDGSGEFSDDIASLAMRRLAIIDQEKGQQPIYSEKETSMVFFNGEIYNYKEIKLELEAKGYTFRTHSDTEVIVYLYEEEGVAMLSKLKGMFAFCIYDLKQNSFLIARDRFGEKPLYYNYEGQLFSFSSEINSLLENDNIDRKVNHEALPYYFRTATIPEPYTLLEGVKILPAGNFMIVDRDGLQTSTYFEVNYSQADSFASEEEAIENIKPVLERAIISQTVSDVPIAAFLSGGIDSSTITAILQKNSSERVKTYNVKFEEESFDESQIARKVAEYWETDHHEIVVPNHDFDQDLFWNLIDHFGMPFRDSSAIPTYLISKEIGSDVKVALSGDGGDEVFGGYDIFQWYLKILDAKKSPMWLRNLGIQGTNILQNLPLSSSSAKLRQVRRGLKTSMIEEREMPIALSEMYAEDQIANLLKLKSKLDFPLYGELAHKGVCSNLRSIMHYRMAHVLPVNMLVKVDRMSMANSLEVRAPFLDPDLFDISKRLTDNMLIQNGKGKHLLRRMMEQELPEEVFSHKKSGFSIPLHSYFNGKFQDLAQDLLFENNPWPKFFNVKLLEEIYNKGIHWETKSPKESVFQKSHQLWMIVQLLAWARRFKVKI